MHLQGRRIVVVKTGVSLPIGVPTLHFYLCHSTEQAQIRKVLLCYEYRDDIENVASRLEFMKAIEAGDLKRAVEIFEQSSIDTLITIEEFASDEASVNQGDALAEMANDATWQIEALVEEISSGDAPLSDEFDLPPEQPTELESNKPDEPSI
jgi:hypothetical protein